MCRPAGCLPRSAVPRLRVLCRLYHIIYLQCTGRGGGWEGFEARDVQQTSWIIHMGAGIIAAQPACKPQPAQPLLHGAPPCAPHCPLPYTSTPREIPCHSAAPRTLRIILQTCVASISCCFLPISVSNTFCWE